MVRVYLGCILTAVLLPSGLMHICSHVFLTRPPVRAGDASPSVWGFWRKEGAAPPADPFAPPAPTAPSAPAPTQARVIYTRFDVVRGGKSVCPSHVAWNLTRVCTSIMCAWQDFKNVGPSADGLPAWMNT